MHRLLNKKFFTALLIILVIVAGLVYLYIRNTSNGKTSQPTPTAKTTSDAPSAQEDFSDGNDRGEPGNTLGEDDGTATVTDNNGQTNSQTNPHKWISSKSGDVTVYSPTSGQLTRSGDQISGKTSLDSVNFRIIDNLSGVIASGKLKVVKGKFSGTIDFSTNADKGRIDVFGTLDSGKEFSNIEIPVKFR